MKQRITKIIYLAFTLLSVFSVFGNVQLVQAAGTYTCNPAPAGATSGYTLESLFHGANGQSCYFTNWSDCSAALQIYKTQTFSTTASCVPISTDETFYCYNEGLRASSQDTGYSRGYYTHCYQTEEECQLNLSNNPNALTGSCATQNSDTTGLYQNSSYINSAIGSSTQQTYQFLAPLNDGNGQAVTSSDLPTYLQGMYRLLIGLSGVIAIIMIVYGGILYMSTDAIFKKKQGKEIIIRTLWGLLLIIGSYVILVSINPTIVGLSTPTLTGNAGSPNANHTPNWVTDVSVSLLGRNYLYERDSSGSDYTMCQTRRASYWLANQSGSSDSPQLKYQASECHTSTNNDLGQQTWCTDLSVSGQGGTVSVGQDCLAGLAYTANSAVYSAVDSKVAWYHSNHPEITVIQNGTRPVTSTFSGGTGGAGTTITQQVPNYAFIENGQACIHTQNADGSMRPSDCTAGSAYTINTATKAICESKASGYRSQYVTFSPSECYDLNASNNSSPQ